MSDHSIADFANRLRACLDTEDADATLVALIAEPDALTQLPRIPRTKWNEDDKPHASVGLATMLVAGALIAAGRSDGVRRFLHDTATLFGRTDWSGPAFRATGSAGDDGPFLFGTAAAETSSHHGRFRP